MQYEISILSIQFCMYFFFIYDFELSVAILKTPFIVNYSANGM